MKAKRGKRSGEHDESAESDYESENDKRTDSESDNDEAGTQSADVKNNKKTAKKSRKRAIEKDTEDYNGRITKSKRCRIDNANKSLKQVKKVVAAKKKVCKKKDSVHESVRVRTSPSLLHEVINELNERQKEAIIEMGFGSLIGISLQEISGSLGYFVVDSLDAKGLVMNISTGSIKIERQTVHDILGIPMGTIDIMKLPMKDVAEGEVPFSTKWKSQFQGKSVRPKTLSQIMKDSDEADFMFKMNFLMLFTSLMIAANKKGAILVSMQNTILNKITEDMSISELDWCGLLLKYLEKCKEDWPPEKNYNFSGAMTFLQILYLDSTICDNYPIARVTPAIRNWKKTHFEKRIEAEIRANGSFGKLQLQPEGPCTDHQNIQNQSSTSRHEGPCTDHQNIQNQSSTSREQYHSKIQKLLSKLESTLDEGVASFPNDLRMVELKQKLEEFLLQGKEKTGDGKGEEDNYDEGNIEQHNNNGNVEENNETLDDKEDQNEEIFEYDGKGEEEKENFEENEQTNEEHVEDDGNGDEENDNANDGDDYSRGHKANEEYIDDDNWLNHEPSDKNFETPRKPIILRFSRKKNNLSDDETSKGKKQQDEVIDEAKDGKQNKFVRARAMKPSKYFKSPYKLKMTDVINTISREEYWVSGSVFIMKHEDLEIVFETESGNVLYRENCQSLAPSMLVDAAVIDTWSLILNEEQILGGGPIKRLFLQTANLSKVMWDGSLKYDEAYNLFNENMKFTLRKDEKLLSLIDVETVFFPILANEHYYLVVFNLKNTEFVIIDNSAATDQYKGKYSTVCDMLRRLFCHYMRDIKHAKSASIRTVKHKLLKMKWRTLRNKNDCGIFLMCHMDTYMGQSEENWVPGFVNEEATGKITQKVQLKRLRSKYCAKILLHETNMHKQLMTEYGKAFRNEYNTKQGKKAISEAVNRKLKLLGEKNGDLKKVKKI